jgi:hypothetical protein
MSVAAQDGLSGIVTLLLAYGATFNRFDVETAVSRGHVKAARLTTTPVTSMKIARQNGVLLAAVALATIACRSDDPLPPIAEESDAALIQAVKKGDRSSVELLLRRGATPNTFDRRSEFESRPLGLAAASRSRPSSRLDDVAERACIVADAIVLADDRHR